MVIPGRTANAGRPIVTRWPQSRVEERLPCFVTASAILRSLSASSRRPTGEEEAAEACGGFALPGCRCGGGHDRADAGPRRAAEEDLRRAARIPRRDGRGLQGPGPQVVRRGRAGAGGT